MGGGAYSWLRKLQLNASSHSARVKRSTAIPDSRLSRLLRLTIAELFAVGLHLPHVNPLNKSERSQTFPALCCSSIST